MNIWIITECGIIVIQQDFITNHVCKHTGKQIITYVSCNISLIVLERLILNIEYI